MRSDEILLRSLSSGLHPNPRVLRAHGFGYRKRLAAAPRAAHVAAADFHEGARPLQTSLRTHDTLCREPLFSIIRKATVILRHCIFSLSSGMLLVGVIAHEAKACQAPAGDARRAGAPGAAGRLSRPRHRSGAGQSGKRSHARRPARPVTRNSRRMERAPVRRLVVLRTI